MSKSDENSQLFLNMNALKGKVSKAAYLGISIAIASIIIATIFVSLYSTGEISIASIIKIHKENFSLWVLYTFPFIFGFWGQYSSSLIVYHAGAMVQDQTSELRHRTSVLEKQANYFSTHDLLTHLPNRAFFYLQIEDAILNATIQQTPLSILLIEIDNYQNIYNTIGRISSDLVLKQITDRLKKISKHIARVEGSTFGMFIQDEQNPEYVAQNIQHQLSSAFVVEHLKIAVHSSIGIVYFPNHGDDVDSLVQRAGVALYKARSNRSGLATYDPNIDKHSPMRLTLLNELRTALKHNELVLYYQPKISLSDKTICGVEALVRWDHPRHGIIGPDEFIPMAERTRTIQNVSKWVIKQAFTDCAKWRSQGTNITISINLSVTDLHDPNLPDLMAEIQTKTNIKPEWIILEVTEGSIMTDPETVLEITQRLHKMGYQFSVDNFGTSYSSLTYLNKMPLCELKIDSTFVQDLLHNENDAIIVKATINLAHNLGLQVVAEGVEDAEVISKLKTYGCDSAQGFYLMKPQTESNFSLLAKNSQWTFSENNKKMKLNQFIEKIKSNQKVSFNDTMAIIDTYYHYTPSTFSNGLAEHTLVNSTGTNEGSCKIFAFAQLNQLDREQTLNLFGDYYQDTLNDPNGSSHQNIRNFMLYGWAGIRFETPNTLTPK